MTQQFAQLLVALLFAATAIGFALHYRNDYQPPRCPDCDDTPSRQRHPSGR